MISFFLLKATNKTLKSAKPNEKVFKMKYMCNFKALKYLSDDILSLREKWNHNNMSKFWTSEHEIYIKNLFLPYIQLPYQQSQIPFSLLFKTHTHTINEQIKELIVILLVNIL